MSINSKANWKEVEGFDRYFISDTGLLYSEKHKKLIKPRENNRGYSVYCLTRSGKHYYRLAHRLVAVAFIPNPLNLPEVNHKDENKHNNAALNLEWCDRKSNVNHGSAISRMKQTQGVSIVQYSPDGQIVKVWASIREAARNGFDFRHIQACLKGKAKKHKGYEWGYLNAD